jgi:EF hand
MTVVFHSHKTRSIRFDLWPSTVVWLAMIFFGFGAASAIASESPVPPKVSRYVKTIFIKYDVDNDGSLTANEWAKMHGDPSKIDADHDGRATEIEFVSHVVNFGRHRQASATSTSTKKNSVATVALFHPATQHKAANLADEPNLNQDRPSTETNSNLVLPLADNQEANSSRPGSRRFHVNLKRLSTKLPEWFLTRDTDGDAQLTQAEFSAAAGPPTPGKFTKFDSNGDGLLTPKELGRLGDLEKKAPPKANASQE